MTGDSYVQLVILFCAGISLALVGGVNVLLQRKSIWLRVGATLPVIAGAAVGVWTLTELAPLAVKTGLLLLAAYSIGLFSSSDRLARIVSSAATWIRKPAALWGAVAGIGIATAIGGVMYHEQQFENDLDRQMTEIGLLTKPPDTRPGADRAATDRGYPVPVKEAILRDDETLHAFEEVLQQNPMVRDNIIRCSPATDRSNCHGWVFTGGRYWVTGSEVNRILSDNDYHTTTEPKPGDLIVYRSGETVLHTALVMYVTDGQPVLVEGKWGCTGVYLHAADKSIYGTSFTYYRSPRKGHLLAGLESPAPAESDRSHSAPNVPAANSDELPE